MGNRSGGWQANIEYFDDYVIKTPKTVEEISEEIFNFLKFKGRLAELDDTVKKMQEDWQIGLRLIKEKKIPNKMLGNLEFLEGGKIKQTRVLVLQDAWAELYDNGKTDEMKTLMKKTMNFIIELWRYGVHEKTFKIGYEFGVMGEDNILIDFGELGNEKRVAEKQIKEKKWMKQMEGYSCQDILDCFNKLANEMLTLDVLNENWDRYNC